MPIAGYVTEELTEELKNLLGISEMFTYTQCRIYVILHFLPHTRLFSAVQFQVYVALAYPIICR